MKPVSISAYSIILENYLDQMIKEGPACCSSATISAVSVVWDHICPDDDDLDEEGIIEFFDFLDDIYKWTSTQKGLKDYLKVRFEEEEEPEGPYFFIGTTEDCFYENFDEFLKDIDFNLCFQSFRKCWERSCDGEDVFQEGQFKIDFKK